MSKHNSLPLDQDDPLNIDTESNIISIKEARKLLGKDFAQFSDEQIKGIASKMHYMARAFLHENSSIN